MASARKAGESAQESLLGRVPPQDIEAEQAVLGCMLLEADSVGIVLERLAAEDFYKAEHQHVFQAMRDMYEHGSPIDVITLREELERRKLLDVVGGSSALAALGETVPSAASAAHYARIVRDRAMLRNLIRSATKILQDSYDPAADPGTLLDNAEQMIFEVAGDRAKEFISPIRVVLKEAFKTIDDLHNRKGRLRGLETGFYELDDLTTGLQGSELIIVAGRPSMGKTTLALNIARHAAVDLSPAAGVLIFSMEMSAQQLAQNLLCMEGRVDADHLRKGLLDEQQFSLLMEAAARLNEAPIFIDDSSALGILDVRAKARRLKAQHDIGLVIVDYLQLMQTRSLDSREREVAELSRGLKALARDINTPVVAISQLNRGPENREDHRPRNSDLRESGSLEQDADVIIFVHREEYYQPNNPEHRHKAEAIVSKQRNGPTGTVNLQFQGNILRFQNLSAQRAAEVEA